MSIKVKEAIKHYQRAIDRSKEEERIVHCISKLCRLPVTVQHLKETGIGKTVNALRKYDGKIGESAKMLVEKWKAMVAAEDSSDGEEKEEEKEDGYVSEVSQDSINKEKERDSLKQGSFNSPSNNRDKSNPDTYKQKHKSKSDKKRSESSDKKERHKEKKSRDQASEEKEVSSSKKEKSKSHKKKDSKAHSSEDSRKNKSNSSKTSKIDEEIDQNNFKLKPESHSKDESKSKVEEDGIDCYSGASFAEALNMASSVPLKKSSSANSSSSSTVSTKRKNPNSPSSLVKKPKLDPQNSLTLTSNDFEVDLKNTYVNESNYFNSIPTKSTTMTEEEALTQLMVTKNQRTKVYSGVKSNKSWSSIPTLFDMCLRILQENIDAIEYTGGVPYSIIKPVLQHATSTQLFALEESNAYLIEDTNELWDYHVKKDFRNKDRLEDESYREMYLRCLEEREVRLKTIASNISQNIARSTPARQTKLAYVDSHVKPPRNVARQQAKYGTSAVTKVPTKGAVKPNPTPRVVPMPRISTAKAKPKMAPLMQKTMKLAKSFKR